MFPLKSRLNAGISREQNDPRLFLASNLNEAYFFAISSVLGEHATSENLWIPDTSKPCWWRSR